MNSSYSMLREPHTSSPLALIDGYLAGNDGTRYQIIRNIARFVSDDNYAISFGDQMNMFPKTQLDSYTGTNLTRERLSRCMNGHLGRIGGKLVLEAGSGAGRFTEILLKEGAIVHSFDYSRAVDANAGNNGASDRLTLVQADIRYLPFEKVSYDYVICLGVLQNIPSPEESIRDLYDMVRPGGYLILDHFLFRWRKVLPPPVGTAEIIYRQFMKFVAQERRLQVSKAIVDLWFPVHWRARKSVLAQFILRRLSPVHFYYPQVELRDKEMYYEWALLDTHDGITDHYKHFGTVGNMRKNLNLLGATEVLVKEGGNGLEAFCRKPE